MDSNITIRKNIQNIWIQISEKILKQIKNTFAFYV